MRLSSTRQHLWLAAFAAAAVCAPGVLCAQPPDPFFKDRTLSLTVGSNPGGTYDTYARLAARHLSRHIAGHPAVVVHNMQGAGSIRAATYLATKAARDGSEIGMISQAMALKQVLGDPAVRINVGAFNWIGRITSVVEATMVWHTSPTRTIEDARRRE